MATITITTSYADSSLLTEAQLNVFKSNTETFLNVTKLNNDNIQNNGITASSKITDASLTAAKLASNSVVTANFTNASVPLDKLASNSVATDKLAAFTVTTPKIAADIITTGKRGLRPLSEIDKTNADYIALKDNIVTANFAQASSMGNDAAGFFIGFPTPANEAELLYSSEPVAIQVAGKAVLITVSPTAQQTWEFHFKSPTTFRVLVELFRREVLQSNWLPYPGGPIEDWLISMGTAEELSYLGDPTENPARGRKIATLPARMPIVSSTSGGTTTYFPASGFRFIDVTPTKDMVAIYFIKFVGGFNRRGIRSDGKLVLAAVNL